MFLSIDIANLVKSHFHDKEIITQDYTKGKNRQLTSIKLHNYKPSKA